MTDLIRVLFRGAPEKVRVLVPWLAPAPEVPPGMLDFSFTPNSALLALLEDF